MAKANMVVTLTVLILLLVSFAESRPLGEVGILNPPTLKCVSVYGVKAGDTCFAIAEAFKLSAAFFQFVNPNINCDKLFVGQWVCLVAKISS